MRPRTSLLVLLASITAVVMTASGIQAAAVPSGHVRAVPAGTMALTAAQHGTAIPSLAAGSAAASGTECGQGLPSARPALETAAGCSFLPAVPSVHWKLVPRAGTAGTACDDLNVSMDGSAATTDNLANVIGEIHWSGEDLSNHILTEIQSGQLLAPPPVANGSNWATFGGVVGVVGTQCHVEERGQRAERVGAGQPV